MATSGARRRPQKYPVELRERALRMVLEIRAEPGGDASGVIGRVAKQLGIGTDSLRGWVKQAEIDGGGHRPCCSVAKANAERKRSPRCCWRSLLRSRSTWTGERSWS